MKVISGQRSVVSESHGRKTVGARTFGFVLATLFLTTVQLAEAQQTAKIYRIGVLSQPTRDLEAFQQGLRELGYVEGQNITIHYRRAWGEEDRYDEFAADRLGEIVAELVRLNVDVIVATNARAALFARRVTTTIPLVVTAIADPVGAKMVGSLSRPAGNITGLSFMSPELGGKRLELLKETIPRLSRVAVLSNLMGSNPVRETSLNEIEVVARSLRLQLQLVNVKRPNEIENAFSSMVRAKVGGLTVLTPPVYPVNRRRIVELAAKNRLPAMYPRHEYVDAGGLMAYGPDHTDLYRRAAIYVDKILKGAKPSDLPVEQPTKFELVINLKIAKALGLTIPPKVLMWADKVIK
jgi:putative ABC transport system substrate-binding protein